jgi:O-antigen ligase
MNRITSWKSMFAAVPLLLAYGLAWHYDGGRTLLLVLTSLVLLWYAVGGALDRWASGIPMPSGFLPKFMLAWLIWYALTLLWSPDPYTSWFYFWILGSLPLAFLGYSLHLGGSEKEKWVWPVLRTGILLSALLLVGWAAWQYYHWLQIGMSQAGLRPYGPLLDTNSFSAWMNLLCFPTLTLWIAATEKASLGNSRALWVGYAYLTLLTLLLLADWSTDSRGGLLSFLCTFIAAYVVFRHRPGIKAKLSLFAAISLVTFSAFQWSRNFDIIGHLTPSFITHNVSTVSRGLMWISTWHMYLNHPFLGIGLGDYFLYYPAYRSPHELASAGTYTHNDYLQFLAEGGPINLLFLLTFAALLFWLLWKLYRKSPTVPVTAADPTEARRLEAFGLVLGVFAITGHALGNFIFYNLPLSLLAGIFLARAWTFLQPEIPTRKPKPGRNVQILVLTGVLLLLIWPVKDLVLDGVSSVLLSPRVVNKMMTNPRDITILYDGARFLAQQRPMDPAPHLFLAALYEADAASHENTPKSLRKWYSMALVQYHDALSGIPREAPVYSAMAALITQHGVALGLSPTVINQVALDYWREALRINPSSLNTRFQASFWLLHHGHPNQGFRLLEAGKKVPLLGERPKILEEMLAQYRATAAGLKKSLAKNRTVPPR